MVGLLWSPTISPLEAYDEAGGDGFGVDICVELSDATAVTEVYDAPVEVGDEREVDADDAAVGEVAGIADAVTKGAVGGPSEEEFAVGPDGEDGNFYGEARAQDAAVDVFGEVAADVGGEIDGAVVAETEVEAECASGVPAGELKVALLYSSGSVDG